MNRAPIIWFLALVTGIGVGYLAWGAQALRTEADLVRDLATLTAQLQEHERVLAELVNQREAKSTAALAECEQTGERMAKQLEGCLFEKAEEGKAEQLDAPRERPLSGTAPFEETVRYPVVIPPKPPEPEAKKVSPDPRKR